MQIAILRNLKRSKKPMLKTIRYLTFFLLLSLLWSCGQPQPVQNEPESAQQESEQNVQTQENPEAAAVDNTSDDTIRIGLLATLDGTFAALGAEGIRGVEMALAEFGGEISGKPVELVIESTDATYDVAYASAKQLIEEDKVDFVVGPLSGDEGLAIKAYAETQPNHTFINGSSAAREMTLQDALPNVFRFNTDGVQWMAGLGQYAYNEKNYKRIVTLGDDYSFMHSQVGGFLVEYCQAGGSVEEQFWAPLGTKNFSSIVSAIPADIDAIFVGLGGTGAVEFLRQYERFGGTAPLIGSSVTLDQTILNEETLAEFIIGAPSAGPTADDNQDLLWQTFAEEYRKQFPDGLDTPSIFAWSYYTNAKAALLALDSIDGDLSDNQQAFQAALADVAFDSPTGPVALDENHQAIAANFLSVVAVDENGNLFRKLVETIPNVNQTLNLPRDEYLALGEFNGGYQGCEQFIQKATN